LNSLIYQNYAIESPVGLIFDTVESSMIVNSSFYQNEALSPEEVLAEITGNCSKL